MKLSIRKYHPSDRDVVCELFSVGIKEHIWPCFYNAMTSPLYVFITASLCIAGYFLGSLLGAVFLPGLWMSIIYYCCHEQYAGYVREKLQTEMRDITGSYMSRPGDCFWVAEAEVEGRAHILGTVAVVVREEGTERFGELFRLIISPTSRRMGLGVMLTQTVIDFSKENGFSKVILHTSNTQAAAVALYKKLGFKTVHCQTFSPTWGTLLSRMNIIYMEKHI